MDIMVLSSNNSARGPMAEALLKRALGDSHTVRSAGHRSVPVHAMAVRVMQEIGLDISAHGSKALREVDTLEVEMTVNLCFGEPGPLLPGRIKRRDWPTPDPLKGSTDEEAVLTRFRAARDQLMKRSEGLAAEIKGAVAV
jgi:arsenate reductase